jgi:hypothetical protein
LRARSLTLNTCSDSALKRFTFLKKIKHSIHHPLIKPIANPMAALPVIGSARLVDGIVYATGICPAAVVSVDTAFCDAI